jgi:hypothetical protein
VRRGRAAFLAGAMLAAALVAAVASLRRAEPQVQTAGSTATKADLSVSASASASAPASQTSASARVAGLPSPSADAIASPPPPHPAARPSAAGRLRKPASACTPPYFFDAEGNRVFRKECL